MVERGELDVRAMPRAFSLASPHGTFLLSRNSTNQLAATRLFLRMLLSVRDPYGDVATHHREGPLLKLADVRIPHGAEALTPIVGDRPPGVGYEDHAREVRRALRTILRRVDCEGMFPNDPSRRYDGLELGGIEPRVDLAEVVEGADLALEAARARVRGAIDDLVAAELLVRGVFADHETSLLHDHLLPFESALLELHADLLRAIIQAAAVSPGDTDAFARAGDAGRALARHRGAFDDASAERFIRTAMDFASDFDARHALLRELFGDELPAGVRDAVAARGRSEPAAEPGRGFGPDELRTGRIMHLGEADAVQLGLAAAPRGRLTPYVRRTAHNALATRVRQALDGHGPTLILLSGDIAAGKTRLAFEVARECCPDAWLVAPTTAAAAARVYQPARHPEIADLDRPVVLWLDDFERFIADDDGGGLTAGHLQALWDVECPPMVVLGTRGGRTRRRVVERSAVAYELERLLALQDGDDVVVGTFLDDDERARAAAVLGEAQLAAVDRFGLGPALCGPALARVRYRGGTAPGHADPPAGEPSEGQALVDALLAWHCATGLPAVPDLHARELWARVRQRRDRYDRPGDEQWRQATSWAAQPIVPGFALVRWEQAAGGWWVDATLAEGGTAALVGLAHSHFGDLIERWVGDDAERAREVARRREAG